MSNITLNQAQINSALVSQSPVSAAPGTETVYVLFKDSKQTFVLNVLSITYDPPLSNGAWNAAVAYATNDIVFYLGNFYRALQTSTNENPQTQPTYWARILTLLYFDGDTYRNEDIGENGDFAEASSIVSGTVVANAGIPGSTNGPPATVGTSGFIILNDHMAAIPPHATGKTRSRIIFNRQSLDNSPVTLTQREFFMDEIRGTSDSPFL